MPIAFLFLVMFPALGTVTSMAKEEIFSLPPIIVEGLPPSPPYTPRPVDPLNPPMKPFSLETGPGLQAVDPPLNALGIPLQQADGREDLTLWRQGKTWLLPSTPANSQGAQIKYGETRGFFGRILRGGKDGGFQLSGGHQTYHQSISYLDNKHTLYRADDDTIETFLPYEEKQYISLQWQRRSSLLLADWDQRKKDLFFNRKNQGREKGERQEINLSTSKAAFDSLDSLQMTLFARRHQFRFASQSDFLSTAQNRAVKGGVSLLQKFPYGISLSALYFQEDLKREMLFPSRVKRFNRHSLLGRGEWKNDFSPWTELHLYFSLEWDRDRSEESTTFQVWNSGLSLSTSRHFPLGGSFKIKQFEKVPLITERFGDGGLLEGNQDLPPEEVLLLSAGPWWKKGSWKISAEVFKEESRHSPLQIMVTPASARTFSLGGVWTQGWQGLLQYHPSAWAIDLQYIYQEALNAGQLNWQRGKQIPGRPPHTLKISLGHTFSLPKSSEAPMTTSTWEWGAHYHYHSPTYLNLTNTLKSPSSKNLGLYLQYQNPGKSWALRGEGHHLLSRPDDISPATFQAKAAPNLLEMDQSQRRYLLTFEVLL